MDERRVTGLLEEPDIDEVLNRAEDLLSRSRGRPEAPPPPPPADLPTLTEVAEADDDAAALRRIDAVPDAGNMRLEMLAQLAPVLERLVEARVVERLGGLADNIALSVKEQLEREIKFIVREAIDQALLSEIERIESARKLV
jgi:hypothetical protein